MYAFALARMGEDGVPALAWTLTNRDENIRREALYAICATTPKLGAALPALAAASHDTNWFIRDVAAATLKALKTRDPLYTNRVGWLRTDAYGNGSYEF